MYHTVFIHSSLDGHLGCFHVVAIVNSVAMNNGIHVSFSILVSSGYMPRSGIAGSYGGLIPSFFFKESAYCLPKWLYQFTFPPTMQEHSFFSTPSPAFIVCRLFDDGHSDQCEVISHYSFDLHFSNSERCWAFFHVFVSHLYVFGKKSKSFSHFLIGLFVVLAVSCMNCLYILEINPLLVVHLLFPILRVVFSPCL